MPLSSHLSEMALAFVFTIATEATILVLFLSRVHPLKWRLFAGIWLTSCTYPILWLTLYAVFQMDQHPENRPIYAAVGEAFVWIAECALFYVVFDRRAKISRAGVLRDMAVIVIANAASYGLGELWPAKRLLDMFTS